MHVTDPKIRSQTSFIIRTKRTSGDHHFCGELNDVFVVDINLDGKSL